MRSLLVPIVRPDSRYTDLMFFILLSPPKFLDQWRSDGTQFMIDMLAAQLFAVPGLEAIRSQWDTKILKSCFKNNVKFSAADGMARVLISWLFYSLAIDSILHFSCNRHLYCTGFLCEGNTTWHC